MLKVKHVADDLWVYQNRKLAGVITLVNLKGQILYAAVDKNGRKLGSSTLYGEVLELITKPFFQIHHDEW